jgi:hypothetical protein
MTFAQESASANRNPTVGVATATKFPSKRIETPLQRVISVHEAGHATLDLILMLPFDYVSSWGDDPGVYFGTARMRHGGPALAHRLAIAHLAGMAAVELFVWPRPPMNGGEIDHERAEQELLKIESSLRPSLTQVYAEARQLVREHKAAVLEVAGQLMGRRSLSFRHVRAIVESAARSGSNRTWGQTPPPASGLSPSDPPKAPPQDPHATGL